MEAEKTHLDMRRRSIPEGPALDRLLRYEASLERSFDRTLSLLEHLQRMRAGQPVLPEVKFGYPVRRAFLGDDRQDNMRRHSGRAIDSLCRRNEVSRSGLVDTGHEFLRIAVDHREPRRLYLDHDAVPHQENVVVIAERDIPFYRLVRRERMRFLVAGEIAAAAHFHGNG